MKLKEAVTPKAMDRLLMKRRATIQSKLKGDIGEYVLTLERMLDILGQTSTKSDEHLKQFLQQWDRERSRQGATGQTIKKKSTKKKKSVKPETQGGLPGEEVVATEPKDEPSAAAPTERPLGDEKPKAKSSIDFGKDMPTFSKLAKTAAKSKSPTAAPSGFEKVYGSNMIGKFAKQNWSVGSSVNVGFQKNLKVVGGSASQGWQLESEKGSKYVFVPSENPRLGRGLYKVG